MWIISVIHRCPDFLGWIFDNSPKNTNWSGHFVFMDSQIFEIEMIKMITVFSYFKYYGITFVKVYR